jgi:hypothetical protein
MCTFDGSLAMEPFSLMFQQKILPNTTSINTRSYLLDVAKKSEGENPLSQA